jgi:DNA-binding IclR family transcriptional regulator
MNFHPLHSVWNALAQDAQLPTVNDVIVRVHTTDALPERPAATRRVVAPRRAQAGNFVDALGHGISLLECWTATDIWLSNSDLAERSGLTRSTVSRLSSVLVDLGYLSRESQRGRLRLTAATLELGFGSPFACAPVAAVHAELARLAIELDVFAALSIRRLDKVQVLDNVASPLHPDAVAMDVGDWLPICRSASGRAAFSAMAEDEAQPLIERLRLRYGARWQPLHQQLERTKQEYASSGYCTSVSSLSRDVAAVAVPIAPAGSADIFILGCGMPAAKYHRERVEQEIVPQLMRVARGLTASLGQ